MSESMLFPESDNINGAEELKREARLGQSQAPVRRVTLFSVLGLDPPVVDDHFLSDSRSFLKYFLNR